MAVKIYNVINRGIRIRENGVFTAPELISDAGVFFEEAGGYYAGGNILVDGKEYAIFVEPITDNYNMLLWSNESSSLSGTFSKFNGRQNTLVLVDNDISSFPAAQYCTSLSINGFSDWHLPAPDELEVCYRYLNTNTTDYNTDIIDLHNQANGYNPNSNPTGDGYQIDEPNPTTSPNFIDSSSNSYRATTGRSGTYWSSLPYDINSAWWQYFVNDDEYSNSGQQGFSSKTSTRNVRAVRWVEV